jgi:hypothetical protein
VEASSTISTEADHFVPVKARSIPGRSNRTASQSLKLGIRMRIDPSGTGIGLSLNIGMPGDFL